MSTYISMKDEASLGSNVHTLITIILERRSRRKYINCWKKNLSMRLSRYNKR